MGADTQVRPYIFLSFPSFRWGASFSDGGQGPPSNYICTLVIPETPNLETEN
jgi:hypothetical protein